MENYPQIILVTPSYLEHWCQSVLEQIIVETVGFLEK